MGERKSNIFTYADFVETYAGESQINGRNFDFESSQRLRYLNTGKS